MATTKKPARATIPLPTDWHDKFKSSSLRVGFALSLTKAMLEFICACADGVVWDRWHFGGDRRCCPDNWLATAGALEKRGLIQRRTDEEHHRAEVQAWHRNETTVPNHWTLTPAGKHIVELVKLAGVYIEADDAISRKTLKKRG